MDHNQVQCRMPATMKHKTDQVPLNCHPQIPTLSPQSLIALLHNEADKEEPRIDISTSTPIQIPILELFNVDNEYWTDVFRASSMRGLTEEMELHELLDLDGEGEVNPEENSQDITRAHINT